VGVLAALTVGLGAAGVAPARSQAGVKVLLSEWKLVPSAQSVAAGKVTFQVKNAGTIDHEFVVMRTDSHHHLLKVKGGKAVETSVQGEIPKVVPGKARSLTLSLKPGKYVLICNLLGHYKAGQYAALRVR
jgi:uncharacterized cupredoxin-like copper-binding protein